MSNAVAHFRLLLAVASASVGLLLAVLYATGMVLPGATGSALWIALAALVFVCFRGHRVPLLSLSRAAVVFYLYVSLALLWPVLFPTIFIAAYSTAFQTADIFARANHLVAIGMAALLAGWLFAFEVVSARSVVSPRTPAYPVRPQSFAAVMLLAAPLLVLGFPTESIFTVGYSGARNLTVGGEIEINVLKPALIICTLLALLTLLQKRTAWRWILWGTFLAVLVFVLGFASGNRVEEIGCLLGTAWLILDHRKSRTVPKAWICLAVALCVFMLILGEVRDEFPKGQVNASVLVDAAQHALQIVPRADTLRMKPSTNGDIALTLCVVIGLVETGVLEIDYGQTFFKYLDMTLPRFLNPGRPVELQVLLRRLAMTSGGLFILAEPYIAGGAFGVWVVLGLSGVLIGSLEALHLRGALRGWPYFGYVLLLSCVPRWFLYSILTMYKHILTGILILLVVNLVTAPFVRGSGRIRAKAEEQVPA
jgi:hypothetical protein